MHPGFAAIAAGPFRFWTHQSDSRAAGVVMDFPVLLVEFLNVTLGEKLRCCMGPGITRSDQWFVNFGSSAPGITGTGELPVGS